jgi:hypothetical protein
MPVSKQSASCELSHVLTPSINSLLLKCCYPNQMVVACSEIWALRKVLKQLPVEMIQQCPSASTCMQTSIVMEEHYTGCQHSTLFFLNSLTQFFFLQTFWACFVNVYASIALTTVWFHHSQMKLMFHHPLLVPCD